MLLEDHIIQRLFTHHRLRIDQQQLLRLSAAVDRRHGAGGVRPDVAADALGELPAAGPPRCRMCDGGGGGHRRRRAGDVNVARLHQVGLADRARGSGQRTDGLQRRRRVTGQSEVL